MSVDTVPTRPPVDDLWMETESVNARPAIDWRAVAILVLTAIPIAIAYTVGLVERCVRIVIAAVVEAYLSGRGISRE